MKIVNIYGFLAAFLSAFGILIIASFGAKTHQPSLFVGLRPRIFVTSLSLNEPIPRFYNIVIGHFLG